MSILYQHLDYLRDKQDVMWHLLEQDYLLSWMLAGIAHTPELKQKFVFKGGTALKKTYFGDYRISQDLDFTFRGSMLAEDELDRLMRVACDKAMQLQSRYGYPIIIECERFIQKTPHPFDQKAFKIMAQFPWHQSLRTKVMVDITIQVPLILVPEERKIIHFDYPETLEGSLYVYPLEEIMAEKIRAVAQFAIKIHERGWGRSRVRDYYDLWSILKHYRNLLDLSILPSIVLKKCEVKNVNFSGPADLFTPELIENIDEEWDRWLRPFVSNVPNQRMVLRELKEELDIIWTVGAIPPDSITSNLET